MVRHTAAANKDIFVPIRFQIAWSWLKLETTHEPLLSPTVGCVTLFTPDIYYISPSVRIYSFTESYYIHHKPGMNSTAHLNINQTRY